MLVEIGFSYLLKMATTKTAAVSAKPAAVTRAASSVTSNSSAPVVAGAAPAPVGQASPAIGLGKGKPRTSKKGADAGEGLDIPGIALIAGGVAALTYGVVQIKAASIAATPVWGPALAGLGLLITYAFWARGRKAAAIDMTLFADRTYALVTVASFIFGIAFSLMFLSSFLFLLGIWGYSQGLTGLTVRACTPSPCDWAQVLTPTTSDTRKMR